VFCDGEKVERLHAITMNQAESLVNAKNRFWIIRAIVIAGALPRIINLFNLNITGYGGATFAQ
jgi:hypothetical protein